VSETRARFHIGQVVIHRLFGYRGVIVDADPCFEGSDEWYATHARSRPPKDAPWYRVLVDEADHVTYVAERNLAPDDSGRPVRHPALDNFLTDFRDGRYRPRETCN